MHNETSNGVTSRIAELRRAMSRAGHPALLVVDAISSLGSIEYRHDEWEVDVTVCGSQKGLMLPPGLGFNALRPRRSRPTPGRGCPARTGTGADILDANRAGFFPYTPATNLLYGLRESLRLLAEEGLPNVSRRHARHAAATRAAVPPGAWRSCARSRSSIRAR